MLHQYYVLDRYFLYTIYIYIMHAIPFLRSFLRKKSIVFHVQHFFVLLQSQSRGEVVLKILSLLPKKKKKKKKKIFRSQEEQDWYHTKCIKVYIDRRYFDRQ